MRWPPARSAHGARPWGPARSGRGLPSTDRQQGVHCVSKSRRQEAREGPRSRAESRLPACSRPSSGRRGLHHRGPRTQPARQHPEGGLPGSGPGAVSAAAPSTCSRYFERGSPALLLGNLLSLGSYLRSGKEQTGDKSSLWPGARGLRGLRGQAGAPAHDHPGLLSPGQGSAWEGQAAPLSSPLNACPFAKRRSCACYTH